MSTSSNERGMSLRSPARFLASAERLVRDWKESGANPAFADRVAEWLLHGETDELLRWQELAPQAVRNHPSTEHFIPLFVALGAGEGGAVTALHRSYAFGMLAMDAYAFG